MASSNPKKWSPRVYGGAHLGLLELHWDLLCPVCRISCEITDTLRAIADHAHCEACNLDFQLDFARSIELIFRVHPEIREADLGVYCVGGPAHSPHVLAQIRVAPEWNASSWSWSWPPVTYRVRGPQLPWSLDFQVKIHRDDPPVGYRPGRCADAGTDGMRSVPGARSLYSKTLIHESWSSASNGQRSRGRSRRQRVRCHWRSFANFFLARSSLPASSPRSRW